MIVASLIVHPSGVPGEALVVLRPHAGLQRYLFPYPAFRENLISPISMGTIDRRSDGSIATM